MVPANRMQRMINVIFLDLNMTSQISINCLILRKMSQKKTNIKHPRAGDRILISPLDWGLGHTTRIIPLIHNWITLGCIVTVAIDDPHTSIISEQFPGIQILKLRGYQVKFTSKNKLIIFYLMCQMPRFLITMFRENRWIVNRLKKEQYDFIISDNRPGFFHSTVPSIYITHQINIHTGFTLLDPIASWMHRNLIGRFHECWVPDWEGKHCLAGDLSNPRQPTNFRMKYLGPLSRLKKKMISKKIRFVAVLSGPEPLRSNFERYCCHGWKNKEIKLFWYVDFLVILLLKKLLLLLFKFMII